MDAQQLSVTTFENTHHCLDKIMSSYTCPYCGRADFKSQRGLTQHLHYNLTCAQHLQRSDDENEQFSGGLTLEASDNSVQAHRDQVQVQKNGPNVPDSVHSDDEQGSTDSENVQAGGVSNVWGSENLMFLDDDLSLESMDCTPEEARPAPFKPSREALRVFREYVDEVSHHTRPFDKYEVEAIKLLDTLRKKKLL